MNLKRMTIAAIMIVIIAAAILIYKIKNYETDVVKVEVEPIPISVDLPQTIGTQPLYEVKILYNTRDLDLLARLIQAEAGSDWCTDELQRAVGSVVLNRMHDERYPDTMHDVIYQTGQYSTAASGKINDPATARARRNAEYLLKHGSTLPTDTIWQANFPQGMTVKELQGVYFGK